MTFKQYLNEVMLTFGKKTHPKFGQVIILSGGAGSGKGFIKSNLIGVQGIVFDVDRLKELVSISNRLNSKIKELYGRDVKDIDLSDSSNVKFMHGVISDLNLSDKKMKAVCTSIFAAAPDRKPNIIFDVTLKDMTKFINIMRNVESMGYYKKNINIVWVLNTIDIAIQQNKTRTRQVPEDILLATHDGASYTMSKLLSMGTKLQNYMDGEIYLTFNQARVDNTLEKSKNGGQYVKDANYILIKPRMKPIDKKTIDQEVINKIKRYVPNGEVW